jgi:hypothetical protein
MDLCQNAMEPMDTLSDEREESYLEPTMTGRVWLYLAKWAPVVRLKRKQGGLLSRTHPVGD